MDVLVTGAAGGLGTEFLKILLSEVPNVRIDAVDAAYGLTASPQHPRHPSVTYYYQRVCNLSYYRANGYDAIVHLAALTSIPQSWDSPVVYHAWNVLDTLELYTYSTRNDPKKPFVLLAGSGGSLYGEGTLHSEGCERKLDSPYAVTKAHQMDYTDLFFPDRSATLLFSNLYFPEGKGALSKLVESAMSGKDFQMDGDGSQVRDYLAGPDAASALFVTMMQEYNGHFNVGSGVGTSLTEAIDAVRKLRPVPVIYSGKDAGVHTATLNPSRFIKEAGWVPGFDLSTGLAYLGLTPP